MAAATCTAFKSPTGGGVVRSALQAASRYDGRVAAGVGSPSELPVPWSASAQRQALERPTELPPGRKGAAWGERDFVSHGDGPLVGRNEDGDAVDGGSAHAACLPRRLASTAGAGTVSSSSSSSPSSLSEASSMTTSSSDSCVCQGRSQAGKGVGGGADVGHQRLSSLRRAGLRGGTYSHSHHCS
jgi:hypothetical protein